MKRDMSTIRHEVESVHHVKEDLEELRDCVDKLEEQHRRRKLRLLEQVSRVMIFGVFSSCSLFPFLKTGERPTNRPAGSPNTLIPVAYVACSGDVTCNDE